MNAHRRKQHKVFSLEKKGVDVVENMGSKRRGRLKKERIKKDVRYQD